MLVMVPIDSSHAPMLKHVLVHGVEDVPAHLRIEAQVLVNQIVAALNDQCGGTLENSGVLRPAEAACEVA